MNEKYICLNCGYELKKDEKPCPNCGCEDRAISIEVFERIKIG